MSIKKKTEHANSLVEPRRALELFQDRHREIHRYLAYLHEDPARETILLFRGDGGNGKTLLLRYLRTWFPKLLQLADWEWIKAHPTENPGQHGSSAVDASSIPMASLDFAMPPHGEDRPQESMSALLILRRQLAEHGIRFPLFDYAIVWCLHKTGRLDDARLNALFGAEELDVLTEVADAVLDSKWVTITSALLKLFVGRASAGTSGGPREHFTLWMQERGLDETAVQRIRALDPETELLPELPMIFAEDLNSAMKLPNAPGRVVLFFDSHEALWGAIERDQVGGIYFQRDEWLRQLLLNLELEWGIVAVVASRDSPQWSEAGIKYQIPNLYVDQQIIGYLPEADALSYLEQAGVNEQALRQSIVQYASPVKGQVHPLYLGLCADVALAASRAGVRLIPETFAQAPQLENKRATLIRWLLKYVENDVAYAIKALSAARAFDYQLYQLLGRELHFNTSEPSFQLLSDLSFVHPSPQQSGEWYRIHELLRRLFREQGATEARRAHTVLEAYYRVLASAGEIPGVSEAIYHRNQLDWLPGADEWVKVFDEALELGRYNLCESLREVRGDLVLETDFASARLLQAEGNYLLVLARYDEAREAFIKVASTYNSILRADPENVDVHNNRGAALSKLGDLQVRLGEYDAAVKTYGEAINSYENVLQRKYDYSSAYNNKGLVLQSLADVHVQLSQHNEAAVSYEQAIQNYEQALALSPRDGDAENNKGNALSKLGNLEGRMGKRRGAMVYFRQALTAYRRASRFKPELVTPYSNKGLLLQSVADLHIQSGHRKLALSTYRQAIKSYEFALKRAESHVGVLNNRGNSLTKVGKLQVELEDLDGALKSYGQALSDYESVLKRASSDVEALNNKSILLVNLGDLQVRTGNYEQAETSYEEAIAILDDLLRRAPHRPGLRSNRGNTLTKLGNLKAHLKDYEQATAYYALAIEEYDQVLHNVADHEAATINKANAVESIGLVEWEMARQAAQQGDSSAERHLQAGCEHLLAALDIYLHALQLNATDDHLRQKIAEVRSLIDGWCVVLETDDDLD